MAKYWTADYTQIQPIIAHIEEYVDTEIGKALVSYMRKMSVIGNGVGEVSISSTLTKTFTLRRILEDVEDKEGWAKHLEELAVELRRKSCDCPSFL